MYISLSNYPLEYALARQHIVTSVLCKLRIYPDQEVKVRYVTFGSFLSGCSIKLYWFARRHESCVQVVKEWLIVFRK